MLTHLTSQTLQSYAQTLGSDSLFFEGPRHTPELRAELRFNATIYAFELKATAGGSAFFSHESVTKGKKLFADSNGPEASLLSLNSGISWQASDDTPKQVVGGEFSSITVYHVHDTSLFAPMRGRHSSTNNLAFANDARNLAAMLLHVRNQHSATYARIRNTIRLAAPFFDDFVFRPQMRGAEEQVRLEWKQNGLSEPFQPTLLSDGTIRFAVPRHLRGPLLSARPKRKFIRLRGRHAVRPQPFMFGTAPTR